MTASQVRPADRPDSGETSEADSSRLGDTSNARPALFSAPGSSPWVIGRWFDLLFIANITWPLFFLAQFADGFLGRTGVQFWQVYFVTTPHRWITLALVFLDRERFVAQKTWFIGIALIVVGICSLVRATTGTITCLLAIDYIWNAWHFASQHHGVYRIYSRLGGPRALPAAAAEKWLMRAFLLYVIVRIAGGTLTSQDVEQVLLKVDWAMLAVPALLLIREAWTFQSARLGGTVYLVSVCSLYSSILWTVHTRRPALMLALTTASALFHAIEYLAIVGWSVQKRHVDRRGMLGLLSWFAPRWGIALTMFVVVLGSVGWMMDRQLLEVWLFVNVIVAFLHYAYDGLIWRRARPKAPRPARAPQLASPEAT